MTRPQPCHCPAPNPACRRAGMPMVGRLWEVCSGNCPAERPCTPEVSEAYRAMWDAQAQGARPTPEPGLLQKAANFASGTAAHVAAGLPTVDDAEHARRLSICNTCEHKKGNTCQLCGCNLKLKARWAEQKCPLSLWAKPAEAAP